MSKNHHIKVVELFAGVGGFRIDAIINIVSGNAVFLKGGSEAINTNKALASVISK